MQYVSWRRWKMAPGEVHSEKVSRRFSGAHVEGCNRGGGVEKIKLK